VPTYNPYKNLAYPGAGTSSICLNVWLDIKARQSAKDIYVKFYERRPHDNFLEFEVGSDVELPLFSFVNVFGSLK